MRRVDASTATLEVFTYKAGLLSAVGHDLLLRVERFELQVDEDRVEGTFDGSSLTVLGAVKDGAVADGVLSEKDKAEVLENIRKYVFKGFKPDQITFVSDELDGDDTFLEGEGTLTIPPNSHDVDFEVAIDDGVAVCELTLHQPDWGITPFSALMGTLRIQPDIRVRLTIPWTS
jgi:hypothetical protein